MQALAFGYKCQECGQGQVLEKIFPQYKTKVKGYPLTVEDARIGVCDQCGAQHFDPNETARWRTIFEDKQAGTYLQPAEIRELRERLALSMEQFAFLFGTTRQSLYNWERADRRVPQSRMADLFMRLVRESQLVGQINVLSFLKDEAAKLGVHLQLLAPKVKPTAPIVAIARNISPKLLGDEALEPLALAADTEAQSEIVVLMTENDKPIARLLYDYQGATLNLAFTGAVPFTWFDAEIKFKDGKREARNHIRIENQEAILLAKTTRTEEDIAQVVLLPQESL